MAGHIRLAKIGRRWPAMRGKTGVPGFVLLGFVLTASFLVISSFSGSILLDHLRLIDWPPGVLGFVLNWAWQADVRRKLARINADEHRFKTDGLSRPMGAACSLPGVSRAL